jgi:hypothetical protein
MKQEQSYKARKLKSLTKLKEQQRQLVYELPHMYPKDGKASEQRVQTQLHLP